MSDKASWTHVGPLAEIKPGSVRTFKREGYQLAVLRTDDGDVFAIDNRCPHEGYPLAQGDLKGCVLTCAWHNWKFDVRDGKCVLGGEGVRTFPTRVEEGVVHVDLAEPDPATLLPALGQSLEQAMFNHDNGRAIRDAVRMLMAGYDPWRLLADVARYDGLRAEYGSTHVLPLAADCGRMLASYPGLDAMYSIGQVIDLCGESNKRLPERPRAKPAPGATLGEFRAAVEGEESERAEAFLRGAFEAGVGRATIEAWLYRVMADHFLDFGHALIYLVKAQELLHHAPSSPAAPYDVDIYAGLLYSTVIGTREDTLPYMRSYFRRLAEHEGELAALHEGGKAGAPVDAEAIRDAVLGGSATEAFDAVWGALRKGATAPAVARALTGAAAHRLYRFDLDVERSADVQEGWLWATHRLTFASAVRNATERFQSPDAIRFLVQAVAFIHSGAAMDAPPERRLPVRLVDADAQGVVEAIVHRDAEQAVGRAAGYLKSGASAAALGRAIEDLCLKDPLVRPIFMAHAVKTTVAAFEEYEAMQGQPDRLWLVLAAVRFLASPVVERQVHRAVRSSIRWVAEGVTPRKLTQ